MDDLRRELTETLGRQGAARIGFADLTSVSEDARFGMPRGLSIAVVLNPVIITDIEQGPTVDYQQEYQRANALLAAMGETAGGILRRHGWQVSIPRPTMEALPPDLRTALPHKTVATRAGLGWIGKNALLVTREFGSAVRLTSVLTDAPFNADDPIDLSCCGNCRICVDVCPGGAPGGVNWTCGMERDDFFSARDCLKAMEKLTGRAGLKTRSICGICIASCPWTRKYLRRGA